MLQVTLNLRDNVESGLVAPITDFNVTIESFTQAALIIGALATFFYLLWGALDWISAAGDSGKIESARKKITQSVVGLVILASVGAFFLVLQYFLGINIISGGGSSECVGFQCGRIEGDKR